MANSSSSSTQWNVIAALVSVKLNRDNYLLWNSQLESVMESQELVQFIDVRTLPPPPETIVKDGKNEANPKFVVWKRSDRLALSWIKATVFTRLETNHV
uniref:Retrotransposon Copia-like N-terminal domain-containing protein n=1 Tax=Nymphaea colorata TaxID=210225 RepID=A0A5K0ZJK6_9MAGN